MKDAARRRVMGMRTVSGAMAVLALSMVGQTCFATGAANDRQIRTLMVQSGLKKQIEQIPLFLQRELSQQRHKFKDLTQEEMDRIDGIAMQAFDATSMNENVRRYIESNLSQNDVTAALDWLESPLGTKITRLEEQSSTPEGHAEMERMAPGLVEEYRGSARIAKIRELDDKLTPKAKKAVEMIASTCEVSRVSAIFAGGSGGSARAGVTKVPLQLNRAIHENRAKQTVGGAPTYILPGGGITFLVDVEKVIVRAFTYVPTPAMVAPLEYSDEIGGVPGHGRP